MKRIIGTLFLIWGILGLVALVILNGSILNVVWCFLFIYIVYRLLQSFARDRKKAEEATP